MSIWSERVEVNVGQRARVDVGPLRVWAERHKGQWLVGGRNTGDDEAEWARVTVHPVTEAHLDDDGPAVERVAAQGDKGVLRVRPLAPPRPLIARTELPLSVPPRTTARVYVGVPVWVRLFDGDVQLYEAAPVRLSDTWFGSTLEGVLCYATRTNLRLDLEGLPRRPYRAICPVDVRNDDDAPLTLERVRLPGPALRLYTDATGVLWTSLVSMVQESGQDLTRVTVRDGSAEVAGRVIEVAAAREPLGAPLVARMFSAMLGHGNPHGGL